MKPDTSARPTKTFPHETVLWAMLGSAPCTLSPCSPCAHVYLLCLITSTCHLVNHLFIKREYRGLQNPVLALWPLFLAFILTYTWVTSELNYKTEERNNSYSSYIIPLPPILLCPSNKHYVLSNCACKFQFSLIRGPKKKDLKRG